MLPLIKETVCITLIFTLLCSCCCSHKQSTCVTENFVFNAEGSVYNVVWKPDVDVNNSVVLSNPPCLDADKKLLARICYNGKWINNHACAYIEKNALCPEEFIQEENMCIYLTKPQAWERNCPFLGTLSEINTIVKDLVWIPVKRRKLYEPIEYVLPGENYGLEFLERQSTEVAEENLGVDGKNCMVSANSKMETTSCDAEYPHVCSYKYNSFLYSCPSKCVPGGLGSSYCFCKTYNKIGNAGNWCNTLAEPRYSYERRILHKLVDDDSCLVGGLQRNSNYRSSYIGNFSLLTINKRSWSFRPPNDIKCAICEVSAISYRKADLLLKFNVKSYKLYLHVYSPESLFKAEGRDKVYCFTDAASDKIKIRVDLDKVWDSKYDSASYSERGLKVFKVSLVDDGPGNYWCEAFQLPNISLVKSNNVIAYKEFYGNEYSLRLIISDVCRFSQNNCKNPSVEYISNLGKHLFSKGVFVKFVRKVRLFYIYNIDITNKRIDILLHLTVHSRLPLEAEYYMLHRHLQWSMKLKQIVVVFFRSSEVCLSDSTFIVDIVLNWKTTSIGTVITPKEYCVQQNGTPVRRKCTGSFFFGSVWGDIEGNCSKDIKPSFKTEILYSLASSNLSADLTRNISLVTENSTDLTAIDLHYLAEALSKIAKLSRNNPANLVIEISKIIDNIMKIDTDTLQQSQFLLNTTDEILDIFENTLLSINISDNMLLLRMTNLIIHISKPFLNNISGLALYGGNEMSFLDSQVVHLYVNSTFDDFLNEDDFEVGVYVPGRLLYDIFGNASSDVQSNAVVVTTIYYTDKFFNSDLNNESIVASRIVSVSIPGYGEFLQTSIPIIFKSHGHRVNQECAFWNYGTSSETNSGYWSTLGGNYLGNWNNSSLEICSFTHLTNFALLIMPDGFMISEDENIVNDIMLEVHDRVLSVISNIGCILSIIGISGIFMTSLIFHSWREKVGTRILIQLCITIFLQIIFLNISNINTSSLNISQDFCSFLGIVLHYIIVSEFLWMLVAAILQFFRFVKVIGPMPNHVILKGMVVGWCLPLLPIICVCIFDYQSYSAGIQGFCYPRGMGMYVGILLPVALIVGANLVVFIAVIRNVFFLSVEASGNSQKILKRQVFLAILLFFLLGLPWIFGLLAEVIGSNSVISYIFVYIFCFTATLQGFVLFIFYVVLDEATRKLWCLLLKRTFRKRIR